MLITDFDQGHQYSDYQTTLDLDSAMVQTRCKVGTTTYRREMFISYPELVDVRSDPRVTLVMAGLAGD
jgi:hypothetical protein